MAKKGMIERERKRQDLVNKYNFIRKSLKIKINMSNSFSSTLQLYRDLELLPRNSMKIRLRNRCFIEKYVKIYGS